MLNIPAEVARVVSPARWYAMEPEEQEELLDWIYEMESMMTHADPQAPERAEEVFEERDQIADAFKAVTEHPGITIRCEGDSAAETWNALAGLINGSS